MREAASTFLYRAFVYGIGGLAILDYARQLGIGISSFVSVGNKADVSGNDLIQYWAQDPRTSVILLYLESFGNPKKFSEIARRVSRAKPIVAVKAGRSRVGARAAQSHTGAVAVPLQTSAPMTQMHPIVVETEPVAILASVDHLDDAVARARRRRHAPRGTACPVRRATRRGRWPTGLRECPGCRWC